MFSPELKILIGLCLGHRKHHPFSLTATAGAVMNLLFYVQVGAGGAA